MFRERCDVAWTSAPRTSRCSPTSRGHRRACHADAPRVRGLGRHRRPRRETRRDRGARHHPHLPHPRGLHRRAHGPRPARSGLHPPQGRCGLLHRRVGLRQDHAGQDPHRDRDLRRRRTRHRRRGVVEALAAQTRPVLPAHPDDPPGPVLGAQPDPDDRADPRATRCGCAPRRRAAPPASGVGAAGRGTPGTGGPGARTASCRSTRTSSPAASVSAWSSPARSPSTPRC